MVNHVVTHGKPCVTMHGKGMHVCNTWHAMCHHAWPFESLYKGGLKISLCGGGSKKQSVGAARRRRRKGKEEGRKGEEKGRKGKEKENGGKGKKKREEERGGREEKERGKRKECCAVNRPGRQRTQNCATRGRFPPTLVILRLGAM